MRTVIGGSSQPVHLSGVENDVVVHVDSAVPTHLHTGKVLLTQGVVTAFPDQPAYRILIHSNRNNSKSVLIGASDLSTANGYELSPGGELELIIVNLNSLYALSQFQGDYITWLAFEA